VSFVQAENYIFCLNIYESLHVQLVVRVFGWPQPTVEIPSMSFEGCSHRKTSACDWDWHEIHRRKVAEWF